MSNLSRRAFLSSLGIAAAAPSVVGKAISTANSTPVYTLIGFDVETCSLDGYFGGDRHLTYTVWRDERGKIMSIKMESAYYESLEYHNSDNDKSSPYFNSDYSALQLQFIPSRSIL